MASSRKQMAVADLKAALKKFAGQKIDASLEEIVKRFPNLFIRVSTYSFTPASEGGSADNIGKVVTESIIVGDSFCNTSELLDVSGFAATSGAGNVTLLISNFLCPDEPGRYYFEPVNIVATAVSASPFFLTTTHSLITTPPDTSATDVQINIFA